MDCRDSALFTGVDEASCENMLRCFSAYEQRFSAGQTILTCGQQQDMIGVLLSGSAALLRLHADGNRTVLENMDEGSVFGEELAFTGFRDGSALIECREDCRVIFMRYDQITKRCENACACHSQVVTNLFQLLSKKSLHLSRRIEVLACRSIREKLLCFFPPESHTSHYSVPPAVFPQHACRLHQRRPQRHDARDAQDARGGPHQHRGPQRDAALVFCKYFS